MTRSGMAATSRAVLYSGFFWKREEFSRVEASSTNRLESAYCPLQKPGAGQREEANPPLYACSNSGSDGRFDMLAMMVNQIRKVVERRVSRGRLVYSFH